MILSSKSLLAGLTLCAFLCCSPKPYSKVVVRPASCSQELQFADCASLGHLFEFAGIVHKPVFLYFYAPWIESCKRMDQFVFAQHEVAYYYNTHFINYKINAGGMSPGPELANRYGITVYPTLLYVDANGKVMHRIEGPTTASQFLETGYYLHTAVEKEMVSAGGGR